MLRETSLEAYRSLENAGALQDQEKQLMRLVHRHFPLPAKFTRKELAGATGWTINVVTGRCHSLVAKGWLTDYEETRDGGHLLSISTSKAAAQVPGTVRPGDVAGSDSPRVESVPSAVVYPAPAAAPKAARSTPNSAQPEKSAGSGGTVIKSMLDDDLKPGDLVMSFGELCEVVVAPGMVTAHYRRNDKPAQHDYTAMTVRPVRRQRRAA